MDHRLTVLELDQNKPEHNYNGIIQIISRHSSHIHMGRGLPVHYTINLIQEKFQPIFIITD